ncbi:MAG: glycerophosphodiester phosphodiesterase family protein [Candidatus Pacearchaeota archaeon]
MIIFSHRGCGFNKEENSIEGFSEAFKKNFSLELDVRKTKDNFLVISHDADLKRVGGIDKKICTINYYEIKKIIPKFSEVCKKIVVPYSKNNLIAVHLKTKEKKIIKEVYAEISSNNLERNFFIFDILKEDIDYARNLNKNIKIGLSIGEKRASESVYLWEDLKNKNFEIVW